jgi:hypothetical protein
VSLVAPEVLREEPAAAPAKPKWLPWPVVRWGAVAAAVAVVAIAVIVQAPRYQERAPQSASVPVAAAKAKAEPEASFASADAKPPAVPATSATPVGLTKEAGPKGGEMAYTAAAGKKVASPTAEMDKLAAAPALPAPVMAQATRQAEAKLQKRAETATGGMVGTMAPSEQAAAPGQADMAVAPKPAGQPTASNENVVMARSAPAAKSTPAREERGNYAADAYRYGGATASGSGAGVAINGQRDASQDFRVRGIAYKWTVTSDGRVQRSTDGRTWFYVPVDPKARLRALASDGDEVWVGGERAALYHSSDSGETWAKVAMDRVAGDIIRIVINSDTLQISTSAGQTISMSHAGMQEAPAKPNSPR